MSDALTGAAAQFGIINALRTGNQLLDMLVCMLVPLMFTGIATALGGVAPAIASGARALKNRTRVTRVVRHVKRTNAWGYAVHSSSRDNVLQRALLLYLSKHVASGHKHAKMSLTQIKEKKTRAWYDSDSGSDSDDEGGLRKLEVTTLPPQDVDVHLGDGVWLAHSVDENSEGGGEKSGVSFKEETTTIVLSASGPAAEERIQAAVDKAYRWYAATQQVKKDETRYMFQMLRPRSGGDKENGGADSRYFKRYALSNEKTFSSLFFEEKERLLYLLDHFANKSGKFAIPGFPHKLGLLLFGPPGTGKTSLIKAMSHYTGRHIVSVPLSKIRTNQELMDLMFDGAYKAINAGKRQDEEDAETLVTVPLGKCIFVMEDVDAAGKVVHRRAAAGATKSVTKTVTRSTSRAVSGGGAADGTMVASPPSSVARTPRAAAAEPTAKVTAKVADAVPAAAAAGVVAAPPLPPLVVEDAAPRRRRGSRGDGRGRDYHHHRGGDAARERQGAQGARLARGRGQARPRRPPQRARRRRRRAEPDRSYDDQPPGEARPRPHPPRPHQQADLSGLPAAPAGHRPGGALLWRDERRAEASHVAHVPARCLHARAGGAALRRV